VLDWFHVLVPDQMSPFNRMVTQLKVESPSAGLVLYPVPGLRCHHSIEWSLNSKLSLLELDWFYILVPDQMSPFNRMVTQLKVESPMLDQFISWSRTRYHHSIEWSLDSRLSPPVPEWFHTLAPNQVSPFSLENGSRYCSEKSTYTPLEKL